MSAVQDPAVLHQISVGKSMTGLFKRCRKLPQTVHRLADITFDRNLEGKAFLLKADSEEQLLLLQQEYIEKIKDIMEGYEHVRYFGGIGKPVNRLRELPASFEQASHAFPSRLRSKVITVLPSSSPRSSCSIRIRLPEYSSCA